MSRHDDHTRLQHMLDHAVEAAELLARHDQASGDARLLQLALTRLVELVGEAAAHVSAGFRQAHPEVPWKDIIGMRNVLIHDYDVIDSGILFDTIQYDLPRLISALSALMDSQEPE